METGLYFLSAPYQGTEEEKAQRNDLSLKAAAEFLRQGIHLFAPIIYVNQIVEELRLPSAEDRREIVMPYLFVFLKVSKGLVLITTEGWKSSWGVRQELKFCQENQIPVYKIDPDQIYGNLLQLLSSPVEATQMIQLLEVA